MSDTYDKEKLYASKISIYTESVPNPDSMKFVFNRMLTAPEDAGRDYASAETATDSPLVRELFLFEFVSRVFIAKNFITISKPAELNWADLIPVVRNFLQNYFEEGEAVFDSENVPAAFGGISPDDTPSVRRIKEILEEYIRPAVEQDGGAIVFREFDEETGKVAVELQGSCSGCPSSTVTLKAGIENLLKSMMPGKVKEVVAEGV